MIAIIGAGVSGLSLAYFLQKKGKDCVLFESSNRIGGYIRTIKSGEYQLELGPNSLLCDAEVMSFLDELGLQNEYIDANQVIKSRFIYKEGKYTKVPNGPASLFFGSYFSFEAKKKIFLEMFNSTKSSANETVADFFKRRFGTEVLEYAVEPFQSGIYAGDVEKQLVLKVFPSILEYENKYGSVLKGAMKEGNANRKRSLSFKGGMETLPKKLAEKIQPIRKSAVKSVFKRDGKLLVETASGTEIFEKVIFAVPSSTMYDLLKNSFDVGPIEKIRYAPMTVVHSVYKKSEIKGSMDGFGGLNPTKENQFTLGSIWTSSVFTGRCNADEVMFTTFVGGDRHASKVLDDDWKIKLKVHEELARNFKIEAEQPIFQHIYQWSKALPQFDINILEAHAMGDKLEKENIFICSNWKDGVSLSDCIKKAKKFSETI